MYVPDSTNPGTVNPNDQSYPAVPGTRARQAPASASANNSSGDIQLPAIQVTFAEPSAVSGIPAEVYPGNASQVRSMPPEVAETRPPARDIQAGSNRPGGGGLPANVIIR